MLDDKNLAAGDVVRPTETKKDITTGLLPVSNELIEKFAGNILEDSSVTILDPWAENHC